MAWVSARMILMVVGVISVWPVTASAPLAGTGDASDLAGVAFVAGLKPPLLMVVGTMVVGTEHYWERSKWYSSMTAATAVRSPCLEQRTTRPVHFTTTSVAVPRTFAGMEIANSMIDPISSAESM